MKVLLNCHCKLYDKFYIIFCHSSVIHKEITQVHKCIIQRCLHNKYIFQIRFYQKNPKIQKKTQPPTKNQTKTKILKKNKPLPFRIYQKQPRRVYLDLTVKPYLASVRYIKKTYHRVMKKLIVCLLDIGYALATLQSPTYFQRRLLHIFKRYHFRQQRKRTKRLEETPKSYSPSSFSRHNQMSVSHFGLIFM